MGSNWSRDDKIEMVKAFAVLETLQKSYGREIDPKETLRAWEFVMGEKYTANQVISAMQAYMEKSNDIPAPSDLIKIMCPPPAKITYAEYKHALEQHAMEGYQMFGFYGQVIKDYEKQQSMENKIPSYYEILEKRSRDRFLTTNDAGNSIAQQNNLISATQEVARCDEKSFVGDWSSWGESERTAFLDEIRSKPIQLKKHLMDKFNVPNEIVG